MIPSLLPGAADAVSPLAPADAPGSLPLPPEGIRFVEHPPTGEGLALACRRVPEGGGTEAVLIAVPHYPQSEQGEALLAWRRAHRVSLRDLAALLGCGPVEISDLCRGKTTVHPDDWPGVLARLAAWEVGR